MAPPKTGKIHFNVRLKAASVEDYRGIASRVGHSSHAMLCAEILEDCLTYLMDGERTRMPDILLELKQRLPATQIHRAYAQLKKEPDECDALKKFIETVVEEKLQATGQQKKTTVVGSSRSTSPTGKRSTTNMNLR